MPPTLAKRQDLILEIPSTDMRGSAIIQAGVSAGISGQRGDGPHAFDDTTGDSEGLGAGAAARAKPGLLF